MQNTLEYGTLHIMLFSSYCFYLPLFFITIIYNKFFFWGGGRGWLLTLWLMKVVCFARASCEQTHMQEMHFFLLLFVPTAVCI